jgi:hypothetical protein
MTLDGTYRRWAPWHIADCGMEDPLQSMSPDLLAHELPGLPFQMVLVTHIDIVAWMASQVAGSTGLEPATSGVTWADLMCSVSMR